tara:strand:- start:1239 stop:1976 length:738 start_codon:yes stop_codon:yes gene_type:complete
MGRARQLADGGLNDAILMDASAADTDVNDNILLNGTDSSSTDAGFNLLYEDGTHDASVALTPSSFTLDSLSVSGATALGELSKGIKFPATQISSADGNTLDDYEEGSWSVGIKGGGTAGTYELNASATKAFYQKIGRVVTVRASVQLSTSITAGGTGNYTFSGLPFNIDASDNAGAGVLLADDVNFSGTNDAGKYGIALSNPSGTDGSDLRLVQMNDDEGFGTLPISAAATDDFFEFTYIYATTD